MWSAICNLHAAEVYNEQKEARRNCNIYIIMERWSLIMRSAHDSTACACHGKGVYSSTIGAFSLALCMWKIPFDTKCRALTKRRIVWHVVRQLTSSVMPTDWLSARPNKSTRAIVHRALAPHTIISEVNFAVRKNTRPLCGILLHIRIFYHYYKSGVAGAGAAYDGKWLTVRRQPHVTTFSHLFILTSNLAFAASHTRFRRTSFVNKLFS